MKRNTLIRGVAKENGVRMWQVAEALGMQESAFSRKLRHELPEHELPEKETRKILAVIAQLAKEVDSDEQ